MMFVDITSNSKYTLNKFQKILPIFRMSENSDHSFIMAVYEKKCFLSFEMSARNHYL